MNSFDAERLARMSNRIFIFNFTLTRKTYEVKNITHLYFWWAICSQIEEFAITHCNQM